MPQPPPAPTLYIAWLHTLEKLGAWMMLPGWVPWRTRAAARASATTPSFFVFPSLSVSVPCFLCRGAVCLTTSGPVCCTSGSQGPQQVSALDPNSWSALTLSGHTRRYTYTEYTNSPTDTSTQNKEYCCCFLSICIIYFPASGSCFDNHLCWVLAHFSTHRSRPSPNRRVTFFAKYITNEYVTYCLICRFWLILGMKHFFRGHVWLLLHPTTQGFWGT